MLVLTRKHNQSIIIDDKIEVMVVEIRGDQVKLGIKAPKTVSIYRSEIYNEIATENQLAVKSQLDRLDVVEQIIKKNEKDDNDDNNKK
ncbi:MAG: carbon storage regulator CsrA [Candidatus Wallbacteria bacterium]